MKGTIDLFSGEWRDTVHEPLQPSKYWAFAVIALTVLCWSLALGAGAWMIWR